MTVELRAAALRRWRGSTQSANRSADKMMIDTDRVKPDRDIFDRGLIR